MTRHELPRTWYGKGSQDPTEILLATVYQLGVVKVAACLPGRDGSRGMDRGALADRLKGWSIDQWALRDLVIIARLERQGLGTNDLARIIAHLAHADSDSDEPGPKVQDVAHEALAACANVLQAVADVPDVIRHDHVPSMEAFHQLQNARDAMMRALDRSIAAYAFELGLRVPWWRRVGAAVCVGLLLVVTLTTNAVMRRPRGRRKDFTITLEDDDERRRPWPA